MTASDGDITVIAVPQTFGLMNVNNCTDGSKTTTNKSRGRTHPDDAGISARSHFGTDLEKFCLQIFALI